MSRTEILEELRRMPGAERRQLVEDIDSEFGDFDNTLSPDQVGELEGRAEAALKHPGRGTPIEEVSAEIKKCLFGKK